MRKSLIAGALGTAALAAAVSLAPSASAIPTSEICSRLDANPTKGEIVEIAIEGIDDGDSAEELGEQFALAATVTCPSHFALIKRVMNEFADGNLS